MVSRLCGIQSWVFSRALRSECPITNNKIMRRVPSSKIIAALSRRGERLKFNFTQVYRAFEAKPHKSQSGARIKAGPLRQVDSHFRLISIASSTVPGIFLSSLHPPLSSRVFSPPQWLYRGKYPIIYIPRIQRTLISAGNRESRNRKTNRKLEN